jgi:hypothetical protein
VSWHHPPVGKEAGAAGPGRWLRCGTATSGLPAGMGRFRHGLRCRGRCGLFRKLVVADRACVVQLSVLMWSRSLSRFSRVMVFWAKASHWLQSGADGDGVFVRRFPSWGHHRGTPFPTHRVGYGISG